MTRDVAPARRRLLVALSLGAGVALLAGATASSGAWAAGRGEVRHAPSSVAHATTTGGPATYGYGNARYDDDTVDPAITALTANPIWDASLDGAVYNQPLVVKGVVYVGTEGDSVYAIAASTGHVLWRTHVGNPVSTSIVDTAPTLGGGCGDISPLGITGTPSIDRATNVLYAAEETLVGGSRWQDVRHWLVAVSLTTHRELWHRQIDPPHGNNPSYYYIAAEQERSATSLYKGHVYVEFGGLDGDCGTYHGYVVGLATTGKGALYSYEVPTQREGGIWGTAGAVISSSGDLYVATGNGSSNSISHFDEGNSVVELSPTLHRLGYYAPSNWVTLNEDDWDLGSASPVLVPGSSLLFAVGKPAASSTPGYLMREGKLGGIGHGAFSAPVCPGGGAFGADASYVHGTGAGAQTFVYAPCGSGTEAVVVHTASPISFHTAWSPSTGSPNGPPVVAGGLVWALDWNGPTLYAMNPVTGHVVFTRSTDGLEHFATPSVGDRTVLVPTQGGVEAFGT